MRKRGKMLKSELLLFLLFVLFFDVCLCIF